MSAVTQSADISLRVIIGRYVSVSHPKTAAQSGYGQSFDATGRR
jgi:hypothetical protein